METIGEDVGRELAVGREELVVEVAPEDRLAVAELLHLLVHDFIADALRMVGRRAARKDRRQDYRRLRLLRVNRPQYLADAENRVARRLLFDREVSGVVRADHEEDALRLVAVELAALVETPEDVFGAVGGDAEVEHLHVALGEVLPELRLAVRFPEVRDRVADEDDLRATVRHDLHLFGVAFPLPCVLVAVVVVRDGADRRERGRCAKRQDCHQYCFFHLFPFFTLRTLRSLWQNLMRPCKFSS